MGNTSPLQFVINKVFLLRSQLNSCFFNLFDGIFPFYIGLKPSEKLQSCFFLTGRSSLLPQSQRMNKLLAINSSRRRCRRGVRLGLRTLDSNFLLLFRGLRGLRRLRVVTVSFRRLSMFPGFA